MPTSELKMLCMANSWKHQERCIAGLLKNGRWIRPVPTAEGGAITEEQCQLDVGRPIQPLDLVGLPIKNVAPLPHQPENQLIAKQPWRLLKERRADDDKIADFLTRCEHSKDSLFGTYDDKISWSGIQTKGVKESLLLIRAVTPHFYRKRTWVGNSQLRSKFEFAGNDYDLAITFEAEYLMREGETDTQSSSDWWFTISLGEPFPPQHRSEEFCYKLIAGAIEIP